MKLFQHLRKIRIVPVIRIFGNTRGFSMIEFIVASALAVLVIGITVRGLNPTGQLATARNSQRTAHVNTLVNAIRANIVDKRTGIFNCAAGDIPSSTAKKMATGAGNYDIAGCLIPGYLYALPYDPRATGAHYVSNSDYDTGYFVIKNASTGQVTVSAPSAELGKTISVIR